MNCSSFLFHFLDASLLTHDTLLCIVLCVDQKKMKMMMIICPKAGLLAFVPPGDEVSEVVSRFLPRRQLWSRNLSKIATQWLEVDSNLRPFSCKTQNIPLHHPVQIKDRLINKMLHKILTHHTDRYTLTLN